ncbi:MAG: hypothetical protein D6681_20195 [Calditrichaeota bacterium]|nr:MAG: hypothetical protein D6681_20195 [Calditrichota bacterium]
MALSVSSGFVGLGVDRANQAVYFTPDNNTTKFFAVEHPIQFSCQINMPSTSAPTKQFLWTNRTGRTLVVKSITGIPGTASSATLTFKRVPSGTSPSSGGTALNTAAALDITNARVDFVLSSTASDLEVADGESVAVIYSTAPNSLQAVVTFLMEPKHNDVTFPNIPS